MATEPSLASLMAPGPADLVVVEATDVVLDTPETAEITVEIAPDGSAEVRLDVEAEAELTWADAGHDDNLARFADSGELSALGMQLLEEIRADDTARSDFIRISREGVKLLGLRQRESSDEEWTDTTIHPVMLRSLVQFQSSAIRELWPPSGPAEVQLFGAADTDLMRCANRVKAELNFYACKKMRGYRRSLKATLLSAAFNGSAFRKIYWDRVRKRPESLEVPAEDLILQWGGTQSLDESTRVTHVQVYDRVSLEQTMAACDWIGELPPLSPHVTDKSPVTDEKQDTIGIKENHIDDRIKIYEVYTHLCGLGLTGYDDDVHRPHIITVDEHGEVRCIRRNWRPDDPAFEAETHFVQYMFIPGFGPYGLGLVHLLGGLTATGTRLFRQVVDANALNNTPSGFKTRGVKLADESKPIAPGEFRDVDLSGGQRISDNIEFLPARPVDPTVIQLIELVSTEADRLAAASEVRASDASAAQTGAMLAVLERALTVLTATQGEAADALGQELDILKRVIQDYDDNIYRHAPLEEDRTADFLKCQHVRCVADPSASTQAQRVLRNQAAIALASQKPDLYDEAELHRRALADLGITDVDKIIPRAEDVPRRDPISENMALLQNRPVKAFIEQDHRAHIAVHMAAAQDPTIRALAGQSSNGPQMMNALSSHVMEHLAFLYRAEMERSIGVPLPPPGEPLPADIEAAYSRMAAQAQMQISLEMPGSPPPPPDPLVVLKERELAQKDRELDQREKELGIRDKIATTNVVQAQLRAEADRKREETRKDVAVLKSIVDEKNIETDAAIKTAQILAMTEAKDADRALEAAKEGIRANFRAEELAQARNELRDSDESEDDAEDNT